jgi:alpha/beta superfamily hydrolase
MLSEVRRLWIPGPTGRLEASLRVACPTRAVAVVSHPHPQQGGTMHNPVVFHSERELYRDGWTTLRFNFRGVGDSDGSYDRGEGETDDVGAAASWLRGVATGAPLVLVGYSFGSICSLRHALRDRSVAAVIAIGLPVRNWEPEGLDGLERPLAVVQAERDEFGIPGEVEPLLRLARPRGKLYVVPDCTHLFPGRAVDAAREVVRAAHDILQALGIDARTPN